MDDRQYYQADCRRLNRKADLTSPDEELTKAEKLLEKLLPKNNQKTPSAPANLPLFSTIARVNLEIKEQLDWDQQLTDASYAVFDTETTGLRPFKGDEIISLGAVVVEKGQVLGSPQFHRLINPLRPVSPQSKKITGITDEMLQDEPTICTVMLDFLEFIGPRILVAHNASFDLAFLNLKLGGAIGARIVNPVIDTVLLASVLFPSLGDYSLENLAPRFNIDLTERHSALGDAKITAALFLQMLPRLAEQGIHDLHQLAQLFVDTEPKGGFPLIF